MKRLNNKQIKQTQDLLGFYKFFFICNVCGSVFGSDYKDPSKLCPNCQEELKKSNKNDKNK